MKGKRLRALLMALAMLMTLCGCGSGQTGGEPEQTRIVADSAGRAVEVPEKIEKVAVTGPMAQMLVFALCPEKLVGVSAAWDTAAREYLDAAYYDLPVLGQLYGGHGQLNPETLLQSGAQVVIDIGEPGDAVAKDMDALSEQMGIPFFHISAALDTFGNACRMLGELLGMPEEAEALAVYCENAYARSTAIAREAEKVRAIYVTGDKGLHVIAKGSYHAQVLDMLTDNVAVVDEPSAKGTGNEVDMEQILAWAPDVILFAPGSIYETVAEDPNWKTLPAIANGTYYEVPAAPCNWMGFPPSVQRLLGMMWLETLLYPDAADFDLKAEVQTYFALFYHCCLTDAQYDALMKNSIDRKK